MKLERSALTEPAVDDVISKELRIYLPVQSCRARFETLLASYNKLLRRQGLKTVMNGNPKTAVQHIINAIRPANLQKLLRSNTSFTFSSLKKGYPGFMKHCLESADAFGRVTNRPLGKSFIERIGVINKIENNTLKFRKKVTEKSSASKDHTKIRSTCLLVRLISTPVKDSNIALEAVQTPPASRNWRSSVPFSKKNHRKRQGHKRLQNHNFKKIKFYIFQNGRKFKIRHSRGITVMFHEHFWRSSVIMGAWKVRGWVPWKFSVTKSCRSFSITWNWENRCGQDKKLAGSNEDKFQPENSLVL